MQYFSVGGRSFSIVTIYPRACLNVLLLFGALFLNILDFAQFFSFHYGGT